MSAPTLDFRDLPPEVRKKLKEQGHKPKVKRPRSMTVHEVRSYAIKALAVMADLTATERGRVIRQMAKLNDV